MHLKVMEQLAQVPKRIGIPPLADAGFKEALAVGAVGAASSSGLTPLPLGQNNFDFGNDGDDKMVVSNPLASNGLSDQYYLSLLSGVINGDSFTSTPGSSGGSDLISSFGSAGQVMFDSSMSGVVADLSAGVGGLKRAMEGSFDDPRNPKRSRFEVLE